MPKALLKTRAQSTSVSEIKELDIVRERNNQNEICLNRFYPKVTVGIHEVAIPKEQRQRPHGRTAVRNDGTDVIQPVTKK